MSQIAPGTLHQFLTGEVVDGDGSPTGANLNPPLEIIRVAINDADQKINDMSKNLAANTGAFRQKTQVFVATEGQTVFTLTEGSYVTGLDRLQVTIGGVKQYLDTGDFAETSGTVFTLSAGVPVGTKVEASWVEGIIISSGVPTAHASTHMSDGSDPLDVTQLKNYQTEVADKIGNLSKSPNSQTWISTSGQLVYTLQSGATYDNTHKGFNVFVNGVKQPDDGTAFTKDSNTQFTLLASASDITAGTVVEATWTETFVPATAGHNSTHYAGGQDALDITQLSGYAANVGDKIDVLSKNAVNVVLSGIDNTGTSNCSILINQLITNNNYATIYFPDGVYNIDQQIAISNYCNLKLSANAVLKCVTAMDKMIYVNRNSGEGTKQFITGGIIDGNGLANNCIYVNLISNYQIHDTVVKNALLYNIYCYGGYEQYLEDIRIDNTLAYSVNPNIVGIRMTATDSVVSNIIVKNCTTGIINDASSNELYSVHIWGNDILRLSSTFGLIANVETHAHFFYADTCAVGVQTNSGAVVYLHNSKFVFSQTYLAQLTSLTPIFIQNVTGWAYLHQCRLSSYGANVKISDYMTRVFLYNCAFSSPFNTSTTYVNILNHNHVYYQVTLSDFTVPASGYKRITIPITGISFSDFYFAAMVNDSNQNVDWKTYLTNGNLNILYFNRTAADVVMSGIKANLTVISNTNLPITTSSFTVV